MFTTKAIILYFLFIGSVTFATKESSPNLCTALTSPNVLLLDQFTKIKLKKSCAHASLTFPPRKFSRKKDGCYYHVPTEWAESINYSKLSESGLVLTSSKRTRCPPISYKDFEIITLKGWNLIDNVIWKTLQANKVKRLLKKNRGMPPTGSPLFIFADEKLDIILYSFQEFSVPLIQHRSALKPKIQ